jgi:hypothetical protein
MYSQAHEICYQQQPDCILTACSLTEIVIFLPSLSGESVEPKPLTSREHSVCGVAASDRLH